VSRPFLAFGLLPAFVVGGSLRLLGLRAQVLTDDELHTVGAVLAMTPAEIVRNVTYDGADYCIPLSALYRLAIDQGLVLGDLAFRAPSLMAGLLALIAMPLLLAPRIGERAAGLFAWALAISPMLIFYSRIARPYMLAALLIFAAMLCFDAWLRTRSARAGVAYAALAAAATFLHLGAAPLIVAPFVYAGFEGAKRGRAGLADLRATVALGAGTAVAMTLPLLPAWSSLVELTRIRRDGQLPPLATWLEVVPLQAGTSQLWLGCLMGALALRGAFVLMQRDARLFGLIASMTCVHVALLLVLSPDRMQEALVLSRYLLFLLPLGLACVALALADAWERASSPASRGLTALAICGLAMLLLATGPLLRPDYRSSAFTHTPSFLRFTRPPDWIPGEKVPSFYHELYARDADTVIIEHPWMRQSSHALAAYQSVHRKRVLLSSIISGLHDPRIDLANLLAPTPDEFLASGAHYAVVHLDLRAEAQNVVSADPHHELWLEAVGPLWEPLRRSGQNTEKRLERAWGAPLHRDERVAVWDLRAVRAERAHSLDSM
jgi:hypothetical protein